MKNPSIISLLQGTGLLQKAVKPGSPSLEPNIREEASASTTAELASPEYQFARKSEIGNVGEDVARSARHKANEWKGIKEAEASGQAESLVTRDKLLKLSPPDLASKVTEQNWPHVLGLHFAMTKLPARPSVQSTLKPIDLKEEIWHEWERSDSSGGNKNSFWYKPGVIPSALGWTHNKTKVWTMGDAQAHARNRFVQMYDSMKQKVEKLASKSVVINPVHDEDIPTGTLFAATIEDAAGAGIKRMQSHARELFEGIMKENKYRGRNGAPDMGHVNGLITYSNHVDHPFKKVGSALMDLNQFWRGMKDRHGEDWRKTSIPQAVEYTKRILSGEKLSDVFGSTREKAAGPKFDPAEAYVAHAERTGPNYQMDTADAQTNFLSLIGKMRAIQWGNGVTDPEREHHLKHAAHALKDLTQTLGLPDEMASINGRLALAIGARGHGKTLAHYEPSLRVMNLTRKKGVGSLAHEWAHAFDNMIFGVLSGRYEGKTRDQEPAHASYLTDVASSWHRGHQNENVRQIAQTINNIDTILHHEVRPRMNQDAIQTGLSERMNINWRAYWFQSKELFARAFEKYIENKMAKQGKKNTYLAGTTDHILWPNQVETERLAPLFDELFDKFRKSPFLKKSTMIASLHKSVETLKQVTSGRHPQSPGQSVKPAADPGKPADRPHVREDTMSVVNYVKEDELHKAIPTPDPTGKSVMEEKERHLQTSPVSHLRQRVGGKPQMELAKRESGTPPIAPEHSDNRTLTWKGRIGVLIAALRKTKVLPESADKGISGGRPSLLNLLQKAEKDKISAGMMTQGNPDTRKNAPKGTKVIPSLAYQRRFENTPSPDLPYDIVLNLPEKKFENVTSTKTDGLWHHIGKKGNQNYHILSFHPDPRVMGVAGAITAEHNGKKYLRAAMSHPTSGTYIEKLNNILKSNKDWQYENPISINSREHSEPGWEGVHSDLIEGLVPDKTLQAPRHSLTKWVSFAGVKGDSTPRVIVKEAIQNFRANKDEKEEDKMKRSYFSHPTFTTAHREAAYARLANEVFKLGQYVPRTTVFRHPLTDQPWSAMEFIPGAKEVKYTDAPEKFKEIENNGDIYKMAIMNMILGNNDRHMGNILLDPGGKVHLIDHGLTFDYSHITTDVLPAYAQHLLDKPIPESVHQWLFSLDSEELMKKLTEMGAPKEVALNAVGRLADARGWSNLVKHGSKLYDTKQNITVEPKIEHKGLRWLMETLKARQLGIPEQTRKEIQNRIRRDMTGVKSLPKRVSAGAATAHVDEQTGKVSIVHPTNETALRHPDAVDDRRTK